MAKQFSIDLGADASRILLTELLRETTARFTPRMQTALLRARQIADQHGHEHVGCEHVFLAIAMDANSIPTQVLAEAGVTQSITERLSEILAGDSYNRQLDEGGSSA